MTRPLSSACTTAMLAPLCVMTAFFALVSVAELFGVTPFAGPTPRNSAEAAALGRAADLMLFLRSGEDPDRVYQVDPEVISSSVQLATTSEAAMWSRQLALVRLLDAEGALHDHETRRRLACLAADLDLDDVAQYLSPAVDHCVPGRALADIVARTSSE